MKFVGAPFVASLKVCAQKKDLQEGIQVHADILNRGLLRHDPYVASALINMYAKCGALPKAQQVFTELPFRNAVLWNALIAGYAQHGKGKEAVTCMKKMQQEGISPNAVTFICILKACGSIQDPENGKRIHEEVFKQNLLSKDLMVGNALLDMYSKCGVLASARKVFDELPVRNVVTWNSLITGYAKGGQSKQALACFEEMRHEGLTPDVVTFISVLGACGSAQALNKGKEIHDESFRQGLLQKEVVLGTALVDMYIKCGALTKAQQVLDRIATRDAVSWSAMISGYAQQGYGEQALECYDRMLCEGLSPNRVTYISLVNACARIGAADKGKQIHDVIITEGLMINDNALGAALIGMYAKFGNILKSQQMFDEIPVRDIAAWNGLIAGYVEEAHEHKALYCFEWLHCEGVSPNMVTFIYILKACGSIGAAGKGQQIHDKLVTQDLLKKDMGLDNALVNMYAKCGLLDRAQEVLDEIGVQKVACWNSLIAGYAQEGLCEEALTCFETMLDKGLSPDAITHGCLLKACGRIGAADKGMQIHDVIDNQGLLSTNLVLGNSLVDMYAKCGLVAKAHQVLNDLPGRDAITWSALIAGYTNLEQYESALTCFEKMRCEGISPTAVTFICIVKACGRIGGTERGKQVHFEIIIRGFMENGVLGTTLMEMYIKCGACAEAEQLLDVLPVQDVVSWNILIAAYSQQGQGEQALNYFERMQGKGHSPDEVTFTCILNACSRSGLLDKGQMYLGNMSKKYWIVPDIELHTCMIDFFCRIGCLDKAIAVTKKMPSLDDSLIWSALLSACLRWGNINIGKWAFQHLVQGD